MSQGDLSEIRGWGDAPQGDARIGPDANGPPMGHPGPIGPTGATGPEDPLLMGTTGAILPATPPVLPTNQGPPLPTPEQTQEEMNKIKQARTRQAGIALQALAEAIIRAVGEVDRVHNVGEYLKSLTLIGNGVGNFRLNIEDVNAEINGDEIAQQVLDKLAHESNPYGKPLRPVILEGYMYGEPESPGPDAPDACSPSDATPADPDGTGAAPDPADVLP